MALSHNALNEFERNIPPYMVDHVDIREDFRDRFRSSAIHFNPYLTEGPFFQAQNEVGG
jgi:hypothetical protein